MPRTHDTTHPIWTAATIVEAVVQFIQREGRTPQRADFAPAQGLPHHRTVARLMRTWQEAVRQALARQEGEERMPIAGEGEQHGDV